MVLECLSCSNPYIVYTMVQECEYITTILPYGQYIINSSIASSCGEAIIKNSTTIWINCEDIDSEVMIIAHIDDYICIKFVMQ